MMKSIKGYLFILFTILLAIGGCSKKGNTSNPSPSKKTKKQMKEFNKKFKKANQRFEDSVKQKSGDMFPEWAKPETDSLSPDASHGDSVAYYKKHPKKKQDDFEE